MIVLYLGTGLLRSLYYSPQPALLRPHSVTEYALAILLNRRLQPLGTVPPEPDPALVAAAPSPTPSPRLSDDGDGVAGDRGVTALAPTPAVSTPKRTRVARTPSEQLAMETEEEENAIAALIASIRSQKWEVGTDRDRLGPTEPHVAARSRTRPPAAARGRTQPHAAARSLVSGVWSPSAILAHPSGCYHCTWQVPWRRTEKRRTLDEERAAMRAEAKASVDDAIGDSFEPIRYWPWQPAWWWAPIFARFLGPIQFGLDELLRFLRLYERIALWEYHFVTIPLYLSM